jgi:hypothetical protein
MSPFSTLHLAVGIRIVVFLVLLPEEKGFFLIVFLKMLIWFPMGG